MVAAEENEKFAQVVQRIDPQCKLLRTWKLEGGVSAQVTVLEIEQSDGQAKKMIVRQHGEVDRQHNPQIASDEFKLLCLLHAEGLSTPRPYYLGQACEIFPTPYIVIEYVEGKTEFAPTDLPDFIMQFTWHLSRIHQIDGSQQDLSFLPLIEQCYTQKLQERPQKVDESLNEGEIRDVLEAVWPLLQHNKSVLLHGDYWLGNILWKDGQLVAAIDWEDAAIGDPLADVANSRLEILWVFGSDAMRRFTHLYQSMTAIDFTNLPYWDLCAALRPASRIAEWAGGAQREKIMREGHRWFINQAFEKLVR